MAPPTPPRRWPALLPLVAMAAALAALCGPIPAAAQAQAAEQRIFFDIPAQPLDAALAAYFKASGVQLLYDSTLANGRRSTAVRGNYAPREALRLLLRGSGLIARYSRANAAIITAPPARESAPLVPLGRVVVREQWSPPRVTPLQRMIFYGQLERALEAHLRRDRRTEHLTFGARVAIHIGAGGTVRQIRIDRSSGDARVDRAIVDVLTGQAVPAPPDGLAQPLLLALRGKPASGD